MDSAAGTNFRAPLVYHIHPNIPVHLVQNSRANLHFLIKSGKGHALVFFIIRLLTYFTCLFMCILLFGIQDHLQKRFGQYRCPTLFYINRYHESESS